MKPLQKNKDQATQWTERWLDSVVTGAATMSQPKLSSVEKRGGGLAAAKAAAQRKKVHLVVLTDDRGEKLIAASQHPFRAIC